MKNVWKHSKKKNIGLLYEFLVSRISSCLVEGKKDEADAALRLIKKYFKPGTELYKEWRLVSTLSSVGVSNASTAGNIMLEAKQQARSIDVEKANRVRDQLSIDMMKKFGNDIFEAHIPNYKPLATAQTLINDWRSNGDIGRIALAESTLSTRMSESVPDIQDAGEVHENPGVGRLIMNAMMKRLNEKYSGVFSPEQRSIVRAYALSVKSSNNDVIRQQLEKVRSGLEVRLDESKAECAAANNNYMVKQLDEVRGALETEDFGKQVDDVTVSRFLMYVKLADELDRKE